MWPCRPGIYKKDLEENKGPLVNPRFFNATTYIKEPNGKDNKEAKVEKVMEC
jgi:hypothetical protein